MNAAKNINAKKNNRKDKIIKRQIDEIESLKNKVSNLEIDCKEKEEIIHSIESFRAELSETIEDLKEKGKQYDMLIDELVMMRKVMNEEVFNGKWKLIKMLMK